MLYACAFIKEKRILINADTHAKAKSNDCDFLPGYNFRCVLDCLYGLIFWEAELLVNPTFLIFGALT